MLGSGGQEEVDAWRGKLERRNRLRFGAAHGRDVEVEDVTVARIRASTLHEVALARNRVALTVVYGALGALGLGFCYGVVRGDVGYVWAVVGPLAAGVLGYYFRHEPREL
jgi:hypothetical protein